MKNKLFLFVLSCLVSSVCISQTSEIPNLINSEVPKFLRALKDLPKYNMGVAFIKLNRILEFEVDKTGSKYGNLRAVKQLKDGEMTLNGSVTLLAVPLPKAFAINLIFFPPADAEKLLES